VLRDAKDIDSLTQKRDKAESDLPRPTDVRDHRDDDKH